MLTNTQTSVVQISITIQPGDSLCFLPLFRSVCRGSRPDLNQMNTKDGEIGWQLCQSLKEFKIFSQALCFHSTHSRLSLFMRINLIGLSQMLEEGTLKRCAPLFPFVTFIFMTLNTKRLKIKEQKGQKGSVMQPGEGYNHRLLALILCDFYI